MSVDKLVDSTLLDAACTYEAGKIREKLGSSAQIAYDLANGKGFGDAIAAIPTGGGGSVTAATGEITLASDFALYATPSKLPGLQLQFKPDIFILAMTNSSWGNKTSPAAGIYVIRLINKAYFPPVRVASNVSTDSLSSNYVVNVCTNTIASSDVSSNGYALNGDAFLNDPFASRYYIDDDGYLWVGRYSSASTYVRSGTFRYFAMKV